MDIEERRKQILENNEKYRENHSKQNKFKKYYQKNIQQYRDYYENNKEEKKEYQKQYYKDHKEIILQKQKNKNNGIY